MTLASGTQIGPYKIIEPIGAGGMGEVYRAKDPRLDREVAIKVLPEHLAKDEQSLVRFEREAKAVAALSHPNILDIHDFGTDRDVSYVVTELLHGESLRQRISQGPIPWQKALEIAIPIAQGLAAAHSKGVVHRDLKPENIFLTSDGRVKILDFGVAQYRPVFSQQELTSAPTDLPATQAGLIMGTIPYMSPEQVRGGAVDARSDIFSFGCVLYEMVTGKRAFQAGSTADTIAAILNQSPDLSQTSKLADAKLNVIVKRCLNKDPDQRFQTAQDLLSELQKLYDQTSHPHAGLPVSQQLRKPSILFPALLLLSLIAVGTFWFIKRSANIDWARNQTPEITRLLNTDKTYAAFQLARSAKQYLSGDPGMDKLWLQVTRPVTVHTTPEDAEVYIKDYRAPASNWELIGRTTLTEARIPVGLLRWKIQKDGYETREVADRFPQFRNPGDVAPLAYTLDKQGTLPAGMVRAQGDNFALQIPGLDHLPAVQLDDFFIDRYEVTNAQFKEFVKGGGYQKQVYWKQKFLKDGRELTWEEAMALFRDSTGRSGPATWEVGDYPKGQDDFPVTGVSWYEAAAYAEFAGKSLPTIYHWNRAAGTWDSAFVIPLSNFGGTGLIRVGSTSALHHFGSYDMAGNAKEWCWNQNGDRRFILGGAWNEPTYTFNDPDAREPFTRLPTFGFRCVKYIKPIPGPAADSIAWAERDYRKETPVPDQAFQIFKSLYSYDRTPLHPVIEMTDKTPESWIIEKVNFEAAYGNEKMTAYLFLPKNASPPFQTVIFFPGSNVIYMRSAENLFHDARNLARIDFVLQSGRAVLYPIYKGTFERGDGLDSDIPAATSFYRDHVIMWHKDLGRSIDYLETRTDIDTTKLAFYGASWGGAMGDIMSALEPRLKVNVFLVGGFYMQKPLPEVDQINFVSRVTIPTLMLNGKYDFFTPMDTSQIPSFTLLGTPEKDKRQVFYDTGHDIPRAELIREVLNWLDKYLGPVKTH